MLFKFKKAKKSPAETNPACAVRPSIPLCSVVNALSQGSQDARIAAEF
jgi:hypothetical protein